MLKREPWTLLYGLVIIMSLVCVAGGAFVTLFYEVENEVSADLEEMPDYIDSEVGDDAVLTGELVENPVLTDDRFPTEIAQYGLVAYEVDEREGDDWTEIDEVYPDLLVDVDGEVIAVNIVEEIPVSGTAHEYELTNNYRLRGFQNGDTVTVVGNRGTEATLTAERMYAGTRDDIVSDSGPSSLVVRGIGLGMIVLGLVIAWFMVQFVIKEAPEILQTPSQEN
jgi:hypothetical protein